MPYSKKIASFFLIVAICPLLFPAVLRADPLRKTLHGHVLTLPSGLVSKGLLPGTNQLRLAIGVPLRDPKGLQDFVAQVSDPASPNFRKYLTPEQFLERYGPSASDYLAVSNFARTNGFTITATHGNRLLLDVQGSVENIQNAFHLNLRSYRHPDEARDFFAPDGEPSVDAGIPVADISGLNNYSLPHPHFKLESISNQGRATPRSGSGTYGGYFGSDFRAAYLPGVTLTGAGQTVGLLQFDGFYTNDIISYESAAGLPNVPIQIILLDGYNGVPTTGANSGDIEVSLDIEMCLSMAPGISGITVFEAGPTGTPNDILNAMAASPQIKQFGCSWGWNGGPTTSTDNIFLLMAAQGQSFFSASGDSDAFTARSNSSNGVDNPSLDNSPSSNPYITTVGGTTLTTTGPGGAWSSETVWNRGRQTNGTTIVYYGSSGGISTFYSLPSWQSGISMAANAGSTTHRNIPDVALTGESVTVYYNNGGTGLVGGTSCAAPLWAGLAALMNQQATILGASTIGFANPAIYAIGKGAGYGSSFHDITTGNNFWSSSTTKFAAVTGYDLCTGWGTPAGQALIDAVVGIPNHLGILPPAAFVSTGPVGGPFTITSQNFVLTNTGSTSLLWSLSNSAAWLNVTVTNGALAPGGTTNIPVSLDNSAYSFVPGIYTDTLIFSNQDVGTVSAQFTLSVGQSLVQNGDFETGSFTGWTLAGNGVIGNTIYNAVEPSTAGFDVVHSGSYGAFLGDSSPATLSQVIATQPGQLYLLSMWLNNPASGAGQLFTVNWLTNGTSTNTLFSVVNPPAFTWTNLLFLVAAADTNSTLQIVAENAPNFFGLDDVVLTPLPSPSFKTAKRSLNDFKLSWVTATNLHYQIQYATNLPATAWYNLTAPFVPTNFSSILVDTNALANSPQRFYRLSIVP